MQIILIIYETSRYFGCFLVPLHSKNKTNCAMDKQILLSSEIHHYAIIPIPDFVDMILKGDDVAMYYLLHNRLNHRLHERYNDYQQQLYDNFEDIIEDFFLYLREHGRYPYQSLRRIKNRDAFETWLLNTFRNYLSNRAVASHLIAYAHQVFSIETLKQHSEVTSLRQQYLDATGFSMHEPSPEMTITIKALWDKLSRWLII